MFGYSKKKFMDSVHHEIGDYWGNYGQRIICFHGKHWMVKSNTGNPEEKNLTLLAYLLGEGWLNIPEIRLLSQDEFRSLDKQIGPIGEGACSDNTYLIRLVQDYARNELVIHNLNCAIASEIVFSCWVHRRDACFGNRAFVSGIPMFFDFNVAFGVDQGDFFRTGPDAGHAGNWRLWRIENEEVLRNLVLLRHLEWEKSFAAMPITNRKCFEEAIQKYIDHIRAFNRKKLFELAKEAGLSNQRSLPLTDFLCKSSAELDISIEKVILILDKDNFNLLSIDNSKYRPVNRADYINIVHAPHPPYLSQEIVQEILRLQNRLSTQENEKTYKSIYNNIQCVRKSMLFKKMSSIKDKIFR